MMKIPLISFKHYHCTMQGNLKWERVGKSPIVMLGEKQKYNLVKSILAHVLYKIHYWAYWKSQEIENEYFKVYPQKG